MDENVTFMDENVTFMDENVIYFELWMKTSRYG